MSHNVTIILSAGILFLCLIKKKIYLYGNHYFVYIISVINFDWLIDWNLFQFFLVFILIHFLSSWREKEKLTKVSMFYKNFGCNLFDFIFCFE